MKTILLFIMTYITHKIVSLAVGLSYNPFVEGLSLKLIADFFLFCIIGAVYHLLFNFFTKLYKS